MTLILELLGMDKQEVSQVPQLEGVDRVLRLVMVTEEKNRAGSHVPGLPNFLLGQEIR